MNGKTVFFAGWGVAAAMAALVAFQSGGKPAGGGDVEEPRPGRARISDVAPDLRRAAQSETRVSPPREEPWQRGVKVPFKNAK